MSKFEGLNNTGSTEGVPLSHILKFHVDRDPDRICFTQNGVDTTRREFDLRTNRLAHALKARGVKFGDFVSIALPNSQAHAEAAFAVWKCGAVPHPISAKTPLVEFQAVLDLVKPAVLVGGSPDLKTTSHILEGEDAGSEYSDAALDPVISPYWKAIGSGGSTGKPKVIVTHVPAKFSPTTCYLGQQVDGTILNPGPQYHNGPFGVIAMGLFTGNHIVNMAKFEPEETLKLIQQYKVDFVVLVPTMMNRIYRLPEHVKTKYDISCLKVMLHSTSACPPWLKQVWIDWLGPEKIVEGYGATEGQGSTIINGVEWLKHRGSVGRAQPGSHIVILDPETGEELPPGQIGEIYFVPDDPKRDPYHYLGAEPKKRGLADTPGDMGYLDKDGYLFIEDRRTDMIVSGGANIFPAEVEAAIDAHPEVRSSVAIGLPHDDLIAAVHAIVDVPDEKMDTAAFEVRLREFLKTQLVPYKIPRTFEFVHAPLRDDAGKVRRAHLRQERLERLAETTRT